MKITMIMIKAYIYSCILRKREHCKKYGILKERELSDIGTQFDKSTDPNIKFTESEQPELKRLKLCPQQSESKTETKIDNNTKEINKVENLTNQEKEIQSTNYTYNDKKISLIKEKDHCTSVNVNFLFSSIKEYMVLNLTDHQLDFYKAKLVNLNDINTFLVDNEWKFRDYQSIFVPYNDKIYALLQNICSEYNADMLFVQRSYEIFISKLITEIFNDADLCALLVKLRAFSLDAKKIVFYSEFFNCMRHFVIFPELMLLGSVYNEHSMDILTFLVRFLNFYLVKNANTKDIRFFVLCILKNAFNSSLRPNIDFFTVQRLQTHCKQNTYNMNFFLWELYKHRRRDIKLKLKKNNVLTFSKPDKIHFKIVLLTFLYQQMICLRYFSVNYEECEQFSKLIIIIIKYNNCPFCDFNTFIELLKNTCLNF